MKIKINIKCSDLFSLCVNNQWRTDYVPPFVPGSFGDYVELEIDTKTGQILNWPKDLTDKTVKQAHAKMRGDD